MTRLSLKQALSVREISELTGWTERHARRIADRDKWQTQISESRGRNGKPEREYLLTSLPADAQARYLQKSKTSGAAETAITKQPGTLPLFPPSQQIQQSPRIALDADELREAEQRYTEIIAPLVEWKNGVRRVIALADGKKVSTFDELLRWVGAQHIAPNGKRSSKGTVRFWFKRYKEQGLYGLVRKLRKDAGASHFFDVHPAQGLFLQNKFCVERLNRLHAWETLCSEAPTLFPKEDLPSYATARRYLGALPAGVTTLGREGAEVYANLISPRIIRGPVPVMQWWISDHRQHDVFVSNTLYSHLKRDEMYRPWLTTIYDWGSHKLIGFRWSPNPTADTIKSAIREPALEFGFPGHFYWDNGRDYKKVKRQLGRGVRWQQTGKLPPRMP